MKYTSLKNDIVNILHSSDYDLYLKFYDENGRNTLDTEKSEWCYISNYNIMIKFMNDENSVIQIWKDKNTLDENMKHIIQRIRELSGLNGVQVQIRIYDDLNQRKIYNLIKNDILKQRESEDMDESVNNDDKVLIETLYNIVNTAKDTKRPSDFYISEAMQLENTRKIFSEIIKEISYLNAFKNTSISETLKPLMSLKTLDEVKEFSKSIKNSEIIKENANNIKNIASFVKKEYLNNGDFIVSKPRTLFVLENVKVYTAKEKNNRENLINAYNQLLSFTQNATKGTDIIREIRNNKICETFNVSRKELVDLWLSRTNNLKIEPKKVFVVENYKGEKVIFNEAMKNGIKALAQYINNGGSRDDIICKNIMLETVKYNQISDFIKTYQDNYKVRKFLPKFKNIFSENANKLSSAYLNFNKELFESVEEEIDYTSQYQKLCKDMGVEHPAIKYLAIENAKKDAEYCSVLMEQTLSDETILTEGLKPYIQNPFTLYNIVKTIMDNQIILNKTLVESVNDSNIKSVATNLYNKICFEDNIVLMPIASSLFNIMHTKNLNESKITYLNTLIKYIK
uniref:Uncharacterized protein n=1 Tax=Myoviridae sp. ctWb16 TaxID=2827690 RepID=A0A8S5T116_9CAUD|nr:MAG TPA: hypothetical protein [Myoviridae sp. ctWb16]